MAELTQEHKTVAKGAFWGLTGGLIFKVLGLVYTVLLARLFAPSEVGIFYLGLGIVYLVGTMSDLGFNSSLGRYLPYFIGKGEMKKAGGIAYATYMVSGALSLFFALSLFLLSGIIADSFSQPELAPVLMVLSLFLLINNLFGVNLAVLGSLMKIKETNLLNNLFTVFKIVATLVFFWLLGKDAVIIAASLTICYPIVLVISFFYVKNAAKENKLEFRGGEWNEKLSLLKDALPIGLAILLVAEITNLAFYTDRLLMGWVLPPEIASEYIGIYTMAVSMALVIPIFPGAVSGIFAPLITKMYGMGKKEEMEKISRTSARWNVFLLAPVAIIMIVFSGEIMQLFYGAAYAGGGIVLAIAAIGIFFRYLASVQGTILGAMRIVKIELLSAGVGLLLNIALNLLLIPLYGMAGAAIAFSLSLAATAAILVYYCKKITGSAFLGEMFVPVLVAFIALLAVFAVKEPLWAATNGLVGDVFASEGLAMLVLQKLVKAAILGVVLGMIFALYFAMLVAIKGIKGEDWEVLLASMRKARVPENVVVKVEGFSKRFC